MNEYPLFVPPQPLCTKKPSEWTEAEAEDYYQWLLNNLDYRVGSLLAFFDEDSSQISEQLLVRVSDKVANILKSELFSQRVNSDFQLTSIGYALSADIGLLLAKLLLQECSPSIHWAICREPKTDVSYNCPVLSGFGKLSLDPIQVSITQSYGILRGKRADNAWRRVFEVWKRDAV